MNERSERVLTTNRFRHFLAVLALSFVCQCLLSTPSVAQDSAVTKEKLRLVADAVLENASFRFVDERTGQRFNSTTEAPADARLRPESSYNDWRYWNGVLNLAMLDLGKVLDDSAYTKFVFTNIAFSFDNYQYFKARHREQDKWSYPFGQMIVMEELDDYGAMGASLIEVYSKGPQKRYKVYLEKAGEYVLTKHHRMDDGTLVRSFPVKWTLWADDLYMSVSFLSRMGKLTGDRRYFEDATRQVINFNKYLFSKEKGLMYHCWYSDVKQPGVAFWGRANGWALLAQVDLLDRLPTNYPLRDTLLALLRRHIDGTARYQSSSGLWHQLLDKEDSYLETSCSAMFTYAIARAVNEGYIEPRYASVARQGWKGVISKIRADGQIEGVCTGTGIGDDLVFYYHRPTPLNDPHGIGAVLLAGAEVLKLRR